MNAPWDYAAAAGLSAAPVRRRFRWLAPIWVHKLAPILLLVASSLGCKAITPSNDREWAPNQALLPYAVFHNDQVTVHNVRNCTYQSEEEYSVEHYDKTYDLGKIRTVDFLMVPFPENPSLAHTMLSFGFEGEEGNEYVCLSVEIRREKGEDYAAVKGALNQYELMYVLGDERDLIRLRTEQYHNDVYLYSGVASPDQVRALFVDVLHRANKLYYEPEFYHAVTNNCTTNLVRHINTVAPGRVPYNVNVLLPGYSDELAYKLGLIKGDESFAQTKLKARINRLAYMHRKAENFSTLIRQ